MGVFYKDPGSTNLDYTVSWSTYLQASETIASSTWTSSSTSLAINTMSNTTSTATVWISGGKVGEVVRMTNAVITNSTPARSDQQSVWVRVGER